MLRNFSLASLCAIGLLIVGCGKSDTTTASGGGSSTTQPSGKKLTIGFSQVGAESAWRTAETQSIQSEAAARGITLKFSDAQGDQQNQIKALHDFLDAGVDAIILAPKIETGWEQALKEVKAANIPVILADRGVSVSDPSLYSTLICSDFVDEGRRAGEWLAKATDGKANIAELLGSPGAAPAIDRQKGFEEVIAKYPDMKIVKSQTGDFALAKGKEVMEAFLKSPEGPSINAVYAHNDDMALGAIQAIEAAGKVPGKDILVVSIDGTKGAMQALVDGKENCVVECNPLLGPAIFDAVNNALKGADQPKKTIMKDEMFDQASAKAVIDSRRY